MYYQGAVGEIAYFVIDENQFPEVTFENSPQEVELKLIKEE